MKMNILNVTEGVYWIDISEANLRILCGSPADIVKHLFKKGLIMNTQKDGVTFETGPNAILLSDSMIQNSSFSNLTEFPVLQMLYRQGLIIPNHPNNDGSKPLLIGSKKQVDIQLEYIFNGNYGLASEEELIKSGASEQLAKDIMRMKLKFAFGKMKNSKELVDSVCVDGSNKVEIKNEVFLQRLAHNKFEFIYKDEKVVVDLNLSEDQSYAPSYMLGHKEVNREYFSIIHSGEGDGWDIYRPCMGSILIFQGKIYLIDTGPFILESLQSLGIGTNEIEGIFQTHAHDDHFAGITSLLQNDHKLKYYCSPIVKNSVIKKLSILLDLEPERLNIFFDFVDLELDDWNVIDGLEVKPSLSPHPIETNIYYFRTMSDSGYKTYGHLADISSFSVLDGMVTQDKEEMGISKSYCDDVKKLYLEHADIKKIDIGGGMIHGQSIDFAQDKSDKLLLAHTSFELSKSDKTIGSGASFGTVDVLVPSMQDYNYSYAYRFLSYHFIGASKSALEMLLNSEVVTFNPNSIIVRENKKIESIYLILSGNIESISSKNQNRNVLSSGTIIGEYQGLIDQSSSYTFRTIGYVRALKISLNKYLNFVIRNNFFDHIERIHNRLNFLNETQLFGKYISSKNLEIIANNMKRVSVDIIDEEILNQKKLYLIENSEVDMYKDGEFYKKLNAGDHINSTMLIFGKKSTSNYRIEKPTTLYSVDIDIFKNIPIVFWKLYLEKS